ncbi:MAG: hypothetical protein RJA70_2710 [Pseudomonadota bacterium]
MMHKLVFAALAGCAALACGTFRESPSSASTANGSQVPSDAFERQPAAPEASLAQDGRGAASPAQAAVAPIAADYRTEDEQNTINVFRLAAASTVFVTQKQTVRTYFGETSEVPSGSGSGFVWDAQGHIVTNFHVIQGAQSLSVTLHDHRVYEAVVRGVEPRKDIAVLQIKNPPANLVPIQVREKASSVEVGQKAIAIGNPFGLDQTLTTGIVSALGREVQGIGGVTIRDMVQTDAAINPGNSGGPLLDSSGHLLGMNTMIFSRSGSSAGIGFAVPMSSIMRVVPQLILTGRAEQVGLGVQIDPSQRLERRLGMAGIIVLRVIAGTPAEAAGLQGIVQTERGISLGDVIVGINDATIADYDDLYSALDSLKAGDKVTVTVLRDRKTLKLQLALVLLE